MPFYGFACPTCGARETHYSKIADRDKARRCENLCDMPMDRLIEAPALRPEIQAYTSPVTGQWVNSRAQRTEDLKRSGSIAYDPEMKKDMARTRADSSAKIDAALDRTIESTVASFHASNLL